jgi:hypothetical protein
VIRSDSFQLSEEFEFSVESASYKRREEKRREEKRREEKRREKEGRHPVKILSANRIPDLCVIFGL